jgi:flagellar export protein FliJ
MANLDPLIRYRKHGVDEKRRFLAKLYNEVKTLQDAKEEASKNLEEETRIAKEMGTAEALSDLGKFTEATREGIKFIDTAIEKLEARIDIAQEEMREAFAELKKIEITQRNREEQEKAEESRKENSELDDIAIENYRRLNEE